jgi:polyhydroxybutyrate depolymerase
MAYDVGKRMDWNYPMMVDMKSFILSTFTRLHPPVLVAVLLLGVGAAVLFALYSGASGLQSGELRSGEFDRTYHVYVPSSYRPDQPAPVLLAFHGFGGTGTGMRMMAGLDTVGDRYGALVVYPDAVPAARRAWALGCPDCTYADTLGVDDAQFTLDLIEELARRYTIDRSRIYATGHSLGGSLVGLLACRHADQIAGVAIVASLLIQEEEAACLPARPVRYLLMIGSADSNVPWNGGGHYGYVAAEETARLWAERNGCTAPPRIDSLPNDGGAGVAATVWSYESCDAVVRLYRLEGHGHGWPRGSPVSAPEEIGRWLLSDE